MNTAVTSVGFEHLQHRAFSPLVRRFAWLRPLAELVLVFLVIVSSAGDASRWRGGALVACMGMLVLVSFRESRYARQWASGPIAVNRLIVSMVLNVIGLAILTLATGGFESPFLPILVLVNYVISMFLSARITYVFAGASALLVWGLVLLTVGRLLPDLVPVLYGGGGRAGHNDALIYVTAVVYTWVLIWGTSSGAMNHSAFERMVKSALDARDEVLANHVEHTRALTAFSGEVAHELKNPLASVKGLAALIAKDLEGKPAERMAVLRREVDRMQEILDGFLNFSRPLVPLNGGRTTLRSLCEQVASLHEGVARQRAVSLVTAEEQPAEVWCDSRKIKQVLINLVQNALDVSPAGGAIELRVLRGEGADARVEVRDRGPGVSEAVRDRVFEPGVTTKPAGSGLGLAIARGLARQHGGDLALRPREGGGCVAELTLPLDGPTPAAPQA
jgi:two-component system sensor histidine kinase HydH